MNEAQPQAQQGPVADPLAMMEATTAPAPQVIGSVVSQQVTNQLPAVVLTTITKPGSLINMSQISPQEIQEIEKLSTSLHLNDETSITMFGNEMQMQYSRGLSQILGQSTLGQTGLYDFIASDLKLSTEIVQAAMEKFATKEGDIGFFRRLGRAIPVLGTHITTAEVLIESRRRLVEIFDRMEVKIAERQRSIVEQAAGIDVLLDSQKIYLGLLRRHILAGERALISLYDQYQVEHRALPVNPDPLQVAELMRKRTLLIGFETRLVSLANAYVKTATILPTQFQTIKTAGQIIMQNLRDTVTITIPDLKVSAIQLVALNNLQEANMQTKSASDQRAIAERQAQELLGQVAIEAKEQQGKVLDEAKGLRELMVKMTELQKKLDDLDVQNAAKRKEADRMNIESMHMFEEAQKVTSQKFLELKKAA